MAAGLGGVLTAGVLGLDSAVGAPGQAGAPGFAVPVAPAVGWGGVAAVVVPAVGCSFFNPSFSRILLNTLMAHPFDSLVGNMKMEVGQQQRSYPPIDKFIIACCLDLDFVSPEFIAKSWGRGCYLGIVLWLFLFSS
jgi:hypothetical protein